MASGSNLAAVKKSAVILSAPPFAPVLPDIAFWAGSGLTAIFFPGDVDVDCSEHTLVSPLRLFYLRLQSVRQQPGLLTRLLLPFFAFPFHICYGMGTLAGLWHVMHKPARPENRSVPRGRSDINSEARGNEKDSLILSFPSVDFC